MSSDGICFECCASCCGLCAIFTSTSLGVWCNQNAFGSRGCGGNRGCCGSCCDESFDEDVFDRELRKDMAKTQAPEEAVRRSSGEQRALVTEQPTADARTSMSLPPAKAPAPPA
ncbi:hypothetical protein BDV98DRAFT_563197 [Pterulicium gracile]|uniref:Uncharacterized protein n=1 Tax=Pterulicium gracile TaxID=1884261 RepID=A0A5C3QQM7_9AGAR|nr:hypothetical protein BDV98DRAFT_563197 [Pterula gracilis]